MLRDLSIIFSLHTGSICLRKIVLDACGKGFLVGVLSRDPARVQSHRFGLTAVELRGGSRLLWQCKGCGARIVQAGWVLGLAACCERCLLHSRRTRAVGRRGGPQESRRRDGSCLLGDGGRAEVVGGRVLETLPKARGQGASRVARVGLGERRTGARRPSRSTIAVSVSRTAGGVVRRW